MKTLYAFLVISFFNFSSLFSQTFSGTGGALTPQGVTHGVVSYTTNVTGVPGSMVAGGTCPSSGLTLADLDVPAMLSYNTQITNVTLVNVQHTFASDLDIRLIAPEGEVFVINLDNGGSTGLDVATDVCFDITSAYCADNWTSTSSTAQPEDCLQFETSENNCGPLSSSFSFICGENTSQIEGVNVTGIWTLEITDDAGGDTGNFDSFSITFSAITPPSEDSDATPIDLLACCVTPCLSGDHTFTGTDGDWSNVANWSPACVPESTLANPYVGSITLLANVNTSSIGQFYMIGDLIVGADVSFTHADGSEFSVDGAITNNGTVDNTGILSCTSGFTNTTGSIYTGTGTLSGSLTNNGTISLE